MPVDLNSDMGESYGVYSIGADDEILRWVTSANVACGWVPRPGYPSEGWVTPPCSWAFLSSLGGSGFFSNMLVAGPGAREWRGKKQLEPQENSWYSLSPSEGPQ